MSLMVLTLLKNYIYYYPTIFNFKKCLGRRLKKQIFSTDCRVQQSYINRLTDQGTGLYHGVLSVEDCRRVKLRVAARSRLVSAPAVGAPASPVGHVVPHCVREQYCAARLWRALVLLRRCTRYQHRAGDGQVMADNLFVCHNSNLYYIKL